MFGKHRHLHCRRGFELGEAVRAVKMCAMGAAKLGAVKRGRFPGFPGFPAVALFKVTDLEPVHHARFKPNAHLVPARGHRRSGISPILVPPVSLEHVRAVGLRTVTGVAGDDLGP